MEIVNCGPVIANHRKPTGILPLLPTANPVKAFCQATHEALPAQSMFDVECAPH